MQPEATNRLGLAVHPLEKFDGFEIPSTVSQAAAYYL